MNFEALIADQPILKALDRGMRARGTPQCLLFLGPEGVGRKSAARLLAQALNCAEAPQGLKPCGVCAACVAIAEDKFADVHLVRPPLFTRPDHPWLQDLPPKDRRTRGLITTAQALCLRRDAGSAPGQGRRKVYILDPAEEVEPEGADTLLKILEEPPSYVVFCLIAQNPEQVRPTVLSRAHVFRFRSLSNERVAQIVRDQAGASADKAQQIALLSTGRPGLGLALASDKNLFKVASEALDLLAECLSGDRLRALRTPPRFEALAARWFKLRSADASGSESSEDGSSAPEPEESPESETEVGEAADAPRRGKVTSTALRMSLGEVLDLLAAAASSCLLSPGKLTRIEGLSLESGTLWGPQALILLARAKGMLAANVNVPLALSVLALGLARVRRAANV